jgi:hypothetical protein
MHRNFFAAGNAETTVAHRRRRGVASPPLPLEAAAARRVADRRNARGASLLGGRRPTLSPLRPAQFGDLWSRRYPLLVHIAGGSVALLIGPLQLWLGATRRRLDWHRTLGTLYVVA